MKCGTINCECGQQFYFESAKEASYKTKKIFMYNSLGMPMQDKIEPTIRCPKCGKEHAIKDYPEKGEEVIEEEPVEE